MDSSKIVLSMVIITLGLVLDLIFYYLMLKFFDVEIIGYYSVIISFFLSFKFITNLGFITAHLKFFPEAKNPIEEAIYNGAYFFFSIIQYSCYISLMLILIPIVPLYEDDISVVYMFFLAIVLRIENFVNPLYLIKKQVVKRNISTVLTFILRIILLISFHNIFINSIIFLIGIIMTSNIVYLILNLYLLRKIRLKKPTKMLIKRYFNFAYPLFIISTFTIFFQNIDVYIINYWIPVTDLANYYTAKRFYQAFIVFTLSVSNILITTFSRNIISGNDEINYELMGRTHKFLNIVIIPSVFVIALYSSRILILIFGEDYRLAGINMTILAFNLIPVSVNCTILIYFRALGKTKLVSLITIIQSLIGLLMLIILTAPIFLNLGIIGASLAIPVTGILTELIFRPIYYKKFKIGFYWGLFRNLIIMFSVFMVQSFINEIFSYPIYLIPLFLLLDLGLYFIINYIFKGLSKEDVRFALNVIRFKNLKAQIFSEIKN